MIERSRKQSSTARRTARNIPSTPQSQYLSAHGTESDWSFPTHAGSKHRETIMGLHKRQSSEAIPRPSRLGEELLLRRLSHPACGLPVQPREVLMLLRRRCRLGNPPTGCSVEPVAVPIITPSFAFSSCVAVAAAWPARRLVENSKSTDGINPLVLVLFLLPAVSDGAFSGIGAAGSLR